MSAHRTMPVLASVACAALIATGCSVGRWPRPAPGRCEALQRGITDDLRLRAMLSVHIHSYWSRWERPRGLQPMPLDDAVELIYCDRGMGAESRRRRTVAKLATYRLDDRQVRSMIAALAGDIDAVRHAIRDLRDWWGWLKPCPPDVLEWWIFNKVEVPSFAWQATCPAAVLVDNRVIPSPSPEVDTVAEVLVEMQVDDVARILDPQSWNTCSTFFEESPDSAYLVENDLVDCSHDEDPSPPQAGEAYDDRVFFEHFEASQAGVDVEFKNLLGIGTWYVDPYPPSGTGKQYNVWYGLLEQCYGRVNKDEDVELETDQGNITATTHEKDPNWTMIRFPKTIMFKDDPGTNGAMQGWLASKEFGEHLVDMTCCTLP